MLWPKVLGQSGTASAAPVFVTSPPKRMSTNVAATVTSARRYAIDDRSVPARSGRLQRRHPLRRKVVLGVGVTVLVGTAVHRGQRRPPVQVRGRGGGGPLQGGGVPRVQGRLGAREQRPEEVDDER